MRSRPEIRTPRYRRKLLFLLSSATFFEWDELDPGELDVIEVGRGGPGEGAIDQVPFRIVRIDGDELRGLASVDRGRVSGILTSAQTPIGPLPSEGGPTGLEPVPAVAWPVALAVSGVLISLSWALMTAVRRRPGRAAA